jgi:hypothetical protein
MAKTKMAMMDEATKAATRAGNRARAHRHYEKKKEEKRKHNHRLLTTTPFPHYKQNRGQLEAVDTLIKRVLRIGELQRWELLLQSKYSLRVVLSIQSTNEEDHAWMKTASTTKATTINPSLELSRSWFIQIRDEKQDEWHTLFKIKKSNLPNAGYGLFAARPYKEGDQIGVFYGRVSKATVAAPEPSLYAMKVRWPLDSEHLLLVDPCICTFILFFSLLATRTGSSVCSRGRAILPLDTVVNDFGGMAVRKRSPVDGYN